VLYNPHGSDVTTEIEFLKNPNQTTL